MKYVHVRVESIQLIYSNETDRMVAKNKYFELFCP